MGIIEELKTKRVLLFDGAMGTMLYKKGLKKGEKTEIFGYKNPDKLLEIHKQYLEAGADIITTNTLGANEFNLKETDYTVEQIIHSAVEVAKKAISQVDSNEKKYVALDIGPTAKMLNPLGDLTEEQAYQLYKRQAIQGEKSKVDLILIETMINLKEAEIAVKASKENTSLPIFCTMTFSKYQRTYMGDKPEDMVVNLEKLGVDAVGINCSLGPMEIEHIVDEILSKATVPVIVQPNAGLPKFINDETVYELDEYEFKNAMEIYIKKGVKILGGCCGTTPNFTKELKKLSK